MHEHLLPSDAPLTVPNTCSNEGKESDGRRDEADTRQQQIFEFIKRYTTDKGYRPRSVTSAARSVSPPRRPCTRTSPTSSGWACSAATRPSRVRWKCWSTRPSGCRALGPPLVGRVAAGSPILAEENIEEYVEVSPLAGGDGGDFVLEVRGDSMKNAGILDGDTVVVRKQATATDGDIVVAIVGEADAEAEATVKRYFRERDHIRLEPENEDFEPIRSPDVKLAGRVIGVFRRCTYRARGNARAVPHSDGDRVGRRDDGVSRCRRHHGLDA